MPTTPNMNLSLPTPGITSGPQYGVDQNNAFTIVDGHNHTSGYGVPVPSAGLDIDSDLSFNSTNILSPRTVRFAVLSATPAGAQDLGCVYVQGVDLYYIDGAGNNVRMTQSGSVSGSAGTITGLPSGTASAAYAAGTFVFQSATATSAVIDGGSFILRNNTASSKGLTLSPPNAMASNYTITLPSLPGSTQAVNIDTSGNMGTITYDAIGQAMTSTGANAVGNSITSMASAPANVIINSITGINSSPANIIANNMSNPSFGGTYIRTGGLAAVVSNYLNNAQLGVIRGTVSSSGAITSGEGFTVTKLGTGNYRVNFTNAFSTVPAMVVTGIGLAGGVINPVTNVSPLTASLGQVALSSPSSGGALDGAFSFIAIGL